MASSSVAVEWGKKYLDICIADQGIGLLGSYKKVPNNEIIDDMEAMKAANRRISSKNRPEAESRGYGIWRYYTE